MNRSAAILTALLFAAPISAGKLYKWVDEEGNVHYGSQVPPEYASQERQILNEQAVTVETVERELTDEELAAIAEAERLERDRQQQVAMQEEADQILLDSYASVADMVSARDQRIDALEAQVNVAAGRIQLFQDELVALERRRRGVIEAGNTPPQDLMDQITETRQLLLENQRFLQARRDDQVAIREQFARDIARYEALKAEEAAEEAAEASGGGY